VKGFQADYSLDLDADRIRNKLKSKKGLKMLEDAKSHSGKGKEKRDSSSAEDSNSTDTESSIGLFSSDGSISSDELEDTQNTNFHKPREKEYHQSYPACWLLDVGEECQLFILRREYQVRAHHEINHNDIHLFFTIPKPTKDELVRELNNYIAEPGEVKINIDFDDEGISTQVAQLEDISWSVKLDAPPPLKPAVFNCGQANKYTFFHPQGDNSREKLASIGRFHERC